MDSIAEVNRRRWNALVEAGVEYTVPWLDLDRSGALSYLSDFGVDADPAGLDVLCLAAGGGQQSAVFGLLGSHVTVFDLADAQLAGDRVAAAHHGFQVSTVQGDMRDLSGFPDDSFDIVWHGWSISFVPDPRRAFQEAARVSRPGGIYTIEFANPIVVAVDDEDWDGRAWPVAFPFVDGEEVWIGQPWTMRTPDGEELEVAGPREFRHSLGTVIGGIADAGFVIERMVERPRGDADAEPGSWDYFCAYLPPWLRLTARFHP